jgi:hypothetical protein
MTCWINRNVDDSGKCRSPANRDSTTTQALPGSRRSFYLGIDGTNPFFQHDGFIGAVL